MKGERVNFFLLSVLLIALCACDSQVEKSAKYLDRGNVLFEREDYSKARLEYKNAARINPADAQAWYRLGLVDEAERNFSGAFSNYLAAEQQNAHYAPAMKKLAQYFLAAGRPDEAQKRISLLLQEQSQDADAHGLNAALLFRQKDLTESEKEGHRALVLDPSNVMAYTVLTGVYLSQENQEKAAETIDAGIQRNPESLPLLLLKAAVCEKAGAVEKRADVYKEIVRIKPKEIRFREDLAKVYLQAGQVDAAQAVWVDGVAQNPDRWDMKKKYVLFLNETRGMEAAERQILTYKAAFPDAEDLTFWLAELYITNKATDRAMALLQQIIDHPESSKEEKYGLNARMSLARIYYLKGNKHLAEQLAEVVLQKDPNNREALFIRARMLAEQGASQEAVLALQTIIRDQPKAEEARQLLAEILLQQGYLDLSIDTLTQLVSLAPSNIQAHVRLAQLLAARSETERALALVSHVTTVDPSYPVGWETLARIAIEAEKWDLAESAIQKLDGFPEQSATATFLRAEKALAQKETDTAISLYKKVFEENAEAPIAKHALNVLEGTMVRSGKIQELVAYLSALPHQTASVQTVLGDASLRLKQKDKAAAAYDLAISYGSDSSRPYMGLARLLMETGKRDEALSLLKKAAELFPSDQVVSLAKAEAFVAAKHYPDALAVYDRLLVQSPNNDIAANNMAQLIADHMLQDPALLEKARVVAERFIRSANPAYLDTLAWVYFRQGQSDQSLTIYERIWAGGTEVVPQIAYHYGSVLHKMGRDREAMGVLRKAFPQAGPVGSEREVDNLLKRIGDRF